MRGNILAMPLLVRTHSRRGRPDPTPGTAGMASRLVAMARDGCGSLSTLAPLACVLAVLIVWQRGLAAPDPQRSSLATASWQAGRTSIRPLAWAPDGMTLAA